jgi:hypothetical protein
MQVSNRKSDEWNKTDIPALPAPPARRPLQRGSFSERDRMATTHAASAAYARRAAGGRRCRADRLRAGPRGAGSVRRAPSSSMERGGVWRFSAGGSGGVDPSRWNALLDPVADADLPAGFAVQQPVGEAAEHHAVVHRGLLALLPGLQVVDLAPGRRAPAPGGPGRLGQARTAGRAPRPRAWRRSLSPPWAARPTRATAASPAGHGAAVTR